MEVRKRIRSKRPADPCQYPHLAVAAGTSQHDEEEPEIKRRRATKTTQATIAPLGDLEGDMRSRRATAALAESNPVELSQGAYTILQQDFTSKAEAYDKLCIGVRTTGHAARVVKTKGKVVFLRSRRV